MRLKIVDRLANANPARLKNLQVPLLSLIPTMVNWLPLWVRLKTLLV